MNDFLKYIKHLLVGLLLFPFFVSGQTLQTITLSGHVQDAKKAPLPYANVVLKTQKDSLFVVGTITNENGGFKIENLKSSIYILEVSMVGFVTHKQNYTVGLLSPFLNLGVVELEADARILTEVSIVAEARDGVSEKMDKKTFNLSNNITQIGGSVLQAIQNLPGVTIQDGKVQLRGNDKVAVLIDGKQNAVTGFGSQTGLDNIPASAIERIEIINNPSARYDANGNAGIINIIYKKNKQEGFNGKVGLTSGLGALWVRKENLPGIRPQYQATPKVNPFLSLNYRKNKVNTFLQADVLSTQTLNRNDFGERIYDDGTVIRQQVKRNRTTTFSTLKMGVDWNPEDQNSFTFSGYLNKERILDRGDIPYFNADLSVRSRLWQFLEDEVKYTATASALYQHKFQQPGHVINAGFNYTFHREDEKYFFTNIQPTFTGEDAFKLLSDEHVADLNFDYIKPLKHGRLETGVKFRRRTIPTNMQFFPGLNSPLDVDAGGWADYKETIPALYGNYVYESVKFEIEAGLRLEYVKVNYDVNPGHNTYTSDGYDYSRPFPNLRMAYKLSDKHKISVFYTERVDRPNEVDIRIFPKYDEPEVIKVGNPTLRPQFTKSIELGHRATWQKGSIYSALFLKNVDATITRIATTVSGSSLIYNIFQNADKSNNRGGEVTLDQQLTSWYKMNISASIYRNTIDRFTVTNKYPVPTTYHMNEDAITSWNAKLNSSVKLSNQSNLQVSAIYLAPDIIPQGKIGSRFSVDMGYKIQIQKGKGELFFNGTDILNTLYTRREIFGNNFVLRSTDYLETQVFRIGYSYKF